MHHPFQDISSPTHPANSVYRNFHSDPTHLQEGQPDKAGNAKFILISLLACKLCPGSPPSSHNPPCSSHTFPPTTSRDLGSSLPPAGDTLWNLVQSNCKCTRGTDDNADFYVISWDNWECQDVSSQKVTLFFQPENYGILNLFK